MRDIATEIEHWRRRAGKGDRINDTLRLMRWVMDCTRRVRASTYDGNVALVLQIIIVRTVALLEHSLRRMLSEAIDRDHAVIDRAKFLREARLDLKEMATLSRKKISVGEIAAHAVHISNLEALLAVVSAMMDEPAADAIKRGIRVGFRRNEQTTRKEYQKLMRGLPRLFRMRHIICHEIRLPRPFTRAVVFECSRCACVLLAILEAAGDKKPNKAPEPTTMAVTPRATSPISK